MKTTDALVESEQFQDFLYAMQRGESIAPCPYCGWSCVVKTDLPSVVSQTCRLHTNAYDRQAFGEWAEQEPVPPRIRSIQCPNCDRATEIEIKYVEEQEAVQ